MGKEFSDRNYAALGSSVKISITDGLHVAWLYMFFGPSKERIWLTMKRPRNSKEDFFLTTTLTTTFCCIEDTKFAMFLASGSENGAGPA